MEKKMESTMKKRKKGKMEGYLQKRKLINVLLRKAGGGLGYNVFDYLTMWDLFIQM